MTGRIADSHRPAGSRRRLASWLSTVALLALAAAGVGGAIQSPEPAAPAPQDSLAESLEPILPLPTSVEVNPARAALGRKLFNDVRLSHDHTQACVTCHPLDRAGVDGLPRAKTANGTILNRNTPTVFNVGFNFYFNWDGAADTLENHAERLLFSPAVMLNTSWPELLDRLGSDPDTVAAFNHAYPEGLTQASLLDALVSFQQSLITPNARFDRYLRGDRSALTADEARGYELFKGFGCVACHQGMNVGGNMFQKFGIFPTAAVRGAAPLDPSGDPGRYAVTQNERDRGVFRVPSLRNVAMTAPYFHDGGASNLEYAVATMARVQLGRTLSAEEIDLIVRFLHTLTGEYQGTPLAKAGPEPG